MSSDRSPEARSWLTKASVARQRGDQHAFADALGECLRLDPDYPLGLLDGPGEISRPSPATARLLLVLTDPRLLATFAPEIERRGYQVDTAATIAEAQATIQRNPPDIVVLGPAGAHAIVSEVRARQPFAAVVLLVCTIRGEIDRDPALAPLVDERLDRPLSGERLAEAIAAALWRRRHAPGLPPVPPPEPINHLRAVAIVVAGYLAIMLARTLVLEAGPAAAATIPIWLVRNRPGLALTIQYRSPAQWEQRIQAVEMREFASPDLTSFEVVLSGNPTRIANALSSIRFESGELSLPPARVFIEPGDEPMAGLTVAIVGFPTAAISNIGSAQFTARYDAQPISVEVERIHGAP